MKKFLGMVLALFGSWLAYAQTTTTAPAPAITWLKEQAKPFVTAKAESGLDDLTAFKTMVGDAKIIGLGEATHGTREFFQMKHRLLEYLVKEMSFTTFAIEATYPEAYAVNDYVLNGVGNAKTALKNLYFWTWNTQEVLDMIEWMRRYNQTVTADKKVKFLGFDMQSPTNAIAYVQNFVRRLEPAEAKNVSDNLACFRLTHASGQASLAYAEYYKTPSETQKKCQESYQTVHKWLTTNRQQLIAKSSSLEFERALRHLVIAQQGLKMFGIDFTNNFIEVLNSRDQSMAENVEWLLENETGNGKIVLWAHNGHVQFSRWLGVQWMGTHLKAKNGANYLSVGFSFERGSVTALDLDSEYRLRAMTIPNNPNPESLESFLQTANTPRFLLDLRTVNPATKTWLNQNRPMHWIGAGLSLRQNSHVISSNVLESHDVLIHFADTSASVLLQ
jgi:erythromycin esterase